MTNCIKSMFKQTCKFKRGITLRITIESEIYSIFLINTKFYETLLKGFPRVAMAFCILIEYYFQVQKLRSCNYKEKH